MAQRINDEFSELRGTMSRQRIYQLRKAKNKLCTNCGQPAAEGTSRCPRCLSAARERQRTAKGSTKRYNSKSYRLEQAE